MSLMPQAPVVFLQYLAALAIVEGIKTYDRGYERVPVRLKWPNDICKLFPTPLPQTGESYVLFTQSPPIPPTPPEKPSSKLAASL